MSAIPGQGWRLVEPNAWGEKVKAECEVNHSAASLFSLVPSIIITRSFKQIAISLQILISRCCQLITPFLVHENFLCPILQRKFFFVSELN